MKHILSTILLLLLTLSAPAQGGAQQEQQKAIAAISGAAARTKALQADFVQTKTLKMLGDKMVAKGEMRYQKGGRLKWEYKSPYAYTFLLDGDKVTLTKGGRTDVIDVNRSKMFKEIARMMMDTMVGKCITDSRTFKVSVKTEKARYVATLLPQKKDMKRMYSRIILVFDRQASTVTRVMMYERNGDCTDIVLKNVVRSS